MAAKGNDRKHTPTGPQHYSPGIERVIERRAIAGVSRATGLSSEVARTIVRAAVAQAPTR
jgi:hypothetical protein